MSKLRYKEGGIWKSIAPSQKEFDDNKAEVTAQLAEKAKKTDVDSALILKRDKTTKLELEDLSSTTLAAIEGGGGTSFNLLSIPQNRSVTPEKTDFASTVLATLNIFNKDMIFANGFSVSTADGTLYAKADFSASDFIEVKANQPYISAKYDRVAEYDANKVFVKATTAKTFTTAANTKYIRTGIANANITTEMIVEGNTLPTTFQPYDPRVQIAKLLLDEPTVKAMFFLNDTLKKNLKITEQNANFIYRNSVNMFDKTAVTPDFRININGTTTARTDYSISDFVEVEPSTLYSLTNSVEVVQYDANKQYISGATGLSHTTGATTKYVRFSIFDSQFNTFMFVKGSSVPSTYVPYNVYAFSDSIQVAKEIKKFEGKTWNVLGDSITNRPTYSYWTLLRPKLGIATVNNYGVSGSSIAVRTGRTDSMLERYSGMVDADVVTVLGGTNDFGSNVPLGTMADRINTTFYGACHLLLSGLVAKYPTKIIAVFTTIPRYNMQEVNSLGLYVHDYMDALREVCGFYGIASFDILRNSQIKAYNETAKTAYIPDGLHPNDAGYDLLAAQMFPLMQGL